MVRLLKRLAAAVAVLLLVLLAGLAGLIWLLMPPHLEVPEQEDQVIAGVTILNPGRPAIPDQTILVREGRIAEIRASQPEDGAALCRGCVAMPGLIDAHVHTPPQFLFGNQRLFALMYLAHGVTAVRDVGQSSSSIPGLATALNNGRIVGPRMFRCGPVLDGEPPSWPVAWIVRDRDDGIFAVRSLAQDGADCIKVYNEVSWEAFDGIAWAAEEAEIPLIGHIPHAVGLESVRNFEAQHMTGLPYLNRPRPPHGRDILNEDVLDMTPEEIDRVMSIALERNIRFTPTLANLQLRLTASDPERFPPSDNAYHLPAFWEAAWDVLVSHPETDEEIDLQLRAYPAFENLVRKAHERGIDILAGSDTLMPWVVPGESMLLEIDALSQAFVDREAALKAATVVNGQHIAGGDIGLLEAGKRADILLLSSDPREDLSALRGWRFVMADGRLYDRETVDTWLRQYDQHFHGPLYRLVTGWLVAAVSSEYKSH